MLRDDEDAVRRSGELLAGYDTLYLELPNRDNVLGPSHLFFSTYLESLWINSVLAAATTLRQAGRLSEASIDGVSRIADEAANLIGEFNEGLSNRQTWHAAALAGIAAWFEDAELMGNAVESRSGLLGHLADGFGTDGMWWEGENYHLFALRGLVQGMRWARTMGFDILEDPEVRDHFRAALLAPARSALPDFTYPARHDSRFGVSLAHPASLELWELGRLFLGEDDELEAWLGALYRVPNPEIGEGYDAWLHDAGLPPPASRAAHRFVLVGRTGHSARPAPRAGLGPRKRAAPGPGSRDPPPGRPLRRPGVRPPAVTGHGHPSRLHLTLHAGGVHWLPDPGTGSYVQETLAWYRSALAHNGPLLDGINAGGADAWCAGFDTAPGWAWIRGRAGGLTRSVLLGPGHLVDLVELEAETPRELLLPWHFRGALEVESRGAWEPAALDDPFLAAVHQDTGSRAGVRKVRVRDPGSQHSLQVFFLAAGAELLRADGPGLPGEASRREFLALRSTTRQARWLTVIDLGGSEESSGVTDIAMDENAIRVETRGGGGPIRYRLGADGVTIESAATSTTLGGLRPAPKPYRPLFQERVEPEATAVARRIVVPPPLDGSLDGFDLADPLVLDSEHQYRRSEEPYDPERFSAEAWINWDGDALYLAVLVRKPELIFRPANAAPLDLDNEPEDINSDGVQVYLAHGGQIAGALINPLEEGRLHDPADRTGRDRDRGNLGARHPTATSSPPASPTRSSPGAGQAASGSTSW